MDAPARVSRLRAAGLLVCVVLSSLGNSPAPYWACEGRREGDSCKPSSYFGCGGDNGTCRLRSGCVDAPETAVNECLECE
jgi:hypothetical protein